MPRKTLIQVRRDTETNWAGKILADGEIGYTNSGTNQGKFKIGDGATIWESLAYQGSGSAYTLTAASSTALGGIKLLSDTSQTVAANSVSATASRTYGAQLNASNQLVVNVPWTDTTNFVSSVSGTGTVSGLTLTGTVTSSGNLTLGGTLSVVPANFASQTANTALIAPNGSNGTPTFRALVTADLPSTVVSKDANSNIQVNNVQKGYASVTSAGTTTTLTAASTYVQRITGTNTQTIQLPDTTTLTNGHVFIIDNDSTGAVTINSSTSTLIDTVSPGSMGYFFVEDNTVNTAAGWGKYAYLPGTVDWGTSSVTGVPNITTSAANFSLLTPTTNSLTLDSGTTGAVNLGTNANGKVVTIGNTTTGTSVSFLAQGAVNTSFNFSGASAAVLQTPGGTGNPTQNLTIQSGTTSQSTTSNTNSGSLTITTGSAANTNVGSGNATTGSISIDVGAASSTAGTQTNGSISIGTTNASSLTIGRSGVATTISGTVSFGTLSGSLNLRSGTATAGTAPLYFGTSSPAILTVPVAGVMENDASILYATPAVSTATTGSTVTGRGIIPATQLYYVNADTTVVTVSSSSTVTGHITPSKSFWLAANTVYEVEYIISEKITNTSGSGTATNHNLIWTFPASAVGAVMVEYNGSLSSQIVQSTTTAWQMVTGTNTATITASISTGTTPYFRYRMKGTVKTGATAGYLQVDFGLTGAVATVWTVATLAGSYAKLTALGAAGADLNVGPLTQLAFLLRALALQLNRTLSKEFKWLATH